MVKAGKPEQVNRNWMRVLNVLVFLVGLALVGVGLWQLSNAACYIGLGVIAMALVVLPGRWRDESAG